MDREQLLSVFPEHRARLAASLVRLVGTADAEDLADETLLRALDAVDEFRAEAMLSTWLHRIALNLAYDLLRRRERSPVHCVGHGADLPDVIADRVDEQALERQQMSCCVQNLLAKLPAPQRQVLAQADMLDQTAPEIARDSGVTTGNVKISLHRARRAMQAALETHCDFEHQETGVLCCVPKVGQQI